MCMNNNIIANWFTSTAVEKEVEACNIRVSELHRHLASVVSFLSI